MDNYKKDNEVTLRQTVFEYLKDMGVDMQKPLKVKEIARDSEQINLIVGTITG